MRQAIQKTGIVLFTLGFSVSLAPAQKGQEHHPMPIDQYIARLEDPKRDAWQKPDAVIKALNLQEGQVIRTSAQAADISLCGWLVQ